MLKFYQIKFNLQNFIPTSKFVENVSVGFAPNQKLFALAELPKTEVCILTYVVSCFLKLTLDVSWNEFYIGVPSVQRTAHKSGFQIPIDKKLDYEKS